MFESINETTVNSPTLKGVKEAKQKLDHILNTTPLNYDINLSKKFASNIYLKREDLQIVRSYKIRGAYNKISSLRKNEIINPVVCASAGNHAQGVAYSCKLLGIHGIIFMPNTTPKQKIERVKMFGEDFIKIILVGDSFDDANKVAIKYSREKSSTFIHPFDDAKVIEGQGTIGLELFEQLNETIDYIVLPIGGGGLAAGIITVFKALSPTTKIIGVEPLGAPSMKTAIEKDGVIELDSIDNFVDGAAVKKVGQLNYEICKNEFDEILLIPEGEVCSTILELYNEEAIVVEPAGALSIAALGHLKEKIKNKNVVCIVSGNNNDITRTNEIRERSLLHKGLKHYFIINFPQRAGALKEFVNDILGPTDDVAHFEYTKKNNREMGPAVVGLELQKIEDLEVLIEKLKAKEIIYEYLNDKPNLFQYLI